MSKKKNFLIYVSKEGYVKFNQLRFSDKYVSLKNSAELFDIILDEFINNHE